MTLSTAGIVGIVFVCVMVAALLAAIIYLYFSSRANDNKRKGSKIEFQNLDENPIFVLGSIEVVDETTREKSLSIDNGSSSKKSKLEQYTESVLNERERYLIRREDEWRYTHQCIKTQLDKLASAVSDINLTADHDSFQSKTTVDYIKAYLEAIEALKLKLEQLINRGSDSENELLENRLETMDNKHLPKEVDHYPELIDHSASAEFVEQIPSCIAAKSADDVVGHKEATDKDINLNLAHIEALSNELDETTSSHQPLPEEEEEIKASDGNTVVVQDKKTSKEIFSSPVLRENENKADLRNQHKIVEEVQRDIVDELSATVDEGLC